MPHTAVEERTAVAQVVEQSVQNVFETLDENNVGYQTYLMLEQIANGTHPRYSGNPINVKKAQFLLWRGKLDRIIDVSSISNGGTTSPRREMSRS